MKQLAKMRLVQESDAQHLIDIYRPYVLNTSITFEYEVPTLEEYVKRIKNYTSQYPWLVTIKEGKISGFAYASAHRTRSAYQWSPESTIYMSPDDQGRGIGRLLYETLFSILKLQGFANVYAGVGLPNEKSVRLHQSMGFQDVGIFHNVGYKLGKWHDTRWFQRSLNEPILEPPQPRKIQDITNDPEFIKVMENANEKILQL